MNDPIEGLLEQLRRNPRVQEERFASNFLNNVGEVLEREGFATARLYLRDKAEQSATRYQARVLLQDVLPTMETCERIRQNRSIGRLILKALPTLQRRGGKT